MCPVRTSAIVIVLFQEATAIRVASGLNAIFASSPPIENGLPTGRPVATSQTYTWPQKEPAASSLPSGLNGWLRQPVPQSVLPRIRSLPVRTSTTTSSGRGLLGSGPGGRAGGDRPGPAPACPSGLPMAMCEPSGLKSGKPPNAATDGGTVLTTRRARTFQIRIGALG